MRIPWIHFVLGGFVLTCFVGPTGCSRSRSPDKYLESADRYYQSRQFEKAKVEYLNALRLQPTNATAILQLGKIFYRQGQLMEAAPFLLEGRRHYPRDVESAQHLATIYLAAGDLAKARIAARAVLEMDPTQEVAMTVLSDTTRTSQEAQELIGLMDQLQVKTGNKAIYHVVRGQLAQRTRDLKRAEGELQMAVVLEPKSATAHLAMAMFWWGQGATNQAEKSFRTAAQVAAPDDPARFRLANFLFRTDRLTEAKKVLEEVTTATPERAGAWNLRAEIALREQNFEECGRFLDRVLGQTPNDFEARMLQAKLRLAQKQPDQAVRILESMAATRPRSSEIQYQLGLAHRANRDSRQASVALGKAVSLDTNNVTAAIALAEVNISRGQTASAIASLTDLIRRAPNFAQAQFLLGSAYAFSGQLESALALYREMRTRFPNDPNVPFQSGLIYRQRGQLAEAQQAFTEARALSRDNLAPLEQLVDLALLANDRAKALALLQPELERYPQSSGLWMLRARIYAAENNDAGTESALEKAIEYGPGNQLAYLMLAELHLKSGKPTESLHRLSAVIEKDPKNVRAFMVSGVINTQIGKFAEAERNYQALLRIDPNNFVALNNLAYLYAEHLGRLDQAYAVAAKARNAAPRNGVVADTLGWIEFRRGNYSEALRALSEARSLMPGRPEVEAHFGLAQYMAGHESEARQALDTALGAADDYSARPLAERRRATLQAIATADPGRMIPLLEQRVKEDPQDLIASLRLGIAYEAAGDLARARDAYDAAYKVNPMAIPVLNRLIGVEMNRDPVRARELARQAQKLDPDDPYVTQTLGRLALKSDDVVTAYSLLQSSARQLTNQAQVWLDLGLAAFGVGRLNESSEAFERASRIGGPAVVTNAAHTSLALLRLSQNPSVAAGELQRIQQILSVDPTSAIAQFASAIALEGQGKYREARDILETLIQRLPNFTPGTRQLAILYAEHLGDDVRGYELAAKARVAMPNDKELAKCFAGLSYRRGDFREAVRLYSEVIRTNPQDATTQFKLGLALHKSGRVTESHSALKKAISMDPKGDFVSEAQTLLSRNSQEK